MPFTVSRERLAITAASASQVAVLAGASAGLEDGAATKALAKINLKD